jgi:hypothetical protein
MALSAALAAGCTSSPPDPTESGWWARLAEPPTLARAQPLEDLPNSIGGWHLASEWSSAGSGGDQGVVLCHGVGGESWRLVPQTTPGDFEARLRSRTEPGGGESYGLAFRRQGANAYLARVDTRNNNVRLYRHEQGTPTLIAARDLGVSVGQWHELAIRAAGPRLAVALDGEPLLRVTDSALAEGEVALWAETQTRVCFAGLWLAPASAVR